MRKRTPVRLSPPHGSDERLPDVPRKRAVRVVVAAEHAVVRAGIAGIVGAEADLDVALLAGSGAEALRCCAEQKAELAVVDYTLPDMDAPQFVRRLRRAANRIPVVVLAVQPSWEYVSRALRAGAAACLSRSAPSDLLVRAVRASAQGDRFVEPRYLERFLAELGPATATSPERTLTDRELQVLTRLAMGWRSKELAAALDLSSSTIDSHRRRILHKLGLRTTADLTRFAIRRGLVRVDG
jgi:DNA-binding NarL/FixJ family response regulator